MASKAFTVNKDNKTITKDDSKLTQKDRDTIAMYIAGGYTLRDKSEKRTETMTKRAAENHFTKEDSELLKDALLHLYEDDNSTARPEGSIILRTLIWWEQDNVVLKNSQLKELVEIKCDRVTPDSIKDYVVEIKAWPGVSMDIKNYGANIKLS